MKRKKEPGPLNQLEAEIAITALHATGEYQVLRKINLERDHRLRGLHGEGARIGLCLDTETTGLDHRQDRIIELGIVAFAYDPVTAEILRVTGRYNGFEDPGAPLAREITEITGITDDMVRGQALDDEQVMALVAGADLVIAHNAAFDRPFVEARYPAFAGIPWACSVLQIDWQAERLQARSLEYLLFKFGWCINAHRALDDAEGVLGLLLERLPVSDRSVFAALLEGSRQSATRIHAVGAPFDKKELLKQRGYRWHDGADGKPKCWWIGIVDTREQEELAFLAREVYGGTLPGGVTVRRIGPLDRFSVREG
ncbi:3'-5' exonuclease [Trichlorobacter ammonificans]|uniref:Exonuclease RNase T and DNA polymerase III n=1 Tax=Trichlorobacter ammonificans TaxID=2916410 RepID=A0ABM9D5X5_9BACT|nr:3'-5' exonuclease [Trichlorobacter ammonificans]CAH2030557.1 Exonuclease RNase T and DNA polymerase III [Trichlorobacter ammonificans]